MARIAYRQPQAGPQGFARTRKVIGGGNPVAGPGFPASPLVGGSTALAADLVIGAQTALFRIPKDFVVTGWFGPAIPDMDTGATLTFSIGDNGNALQAANTARWLSASAVGQAGGALPAILTANLYFQYLMDTDLLLTITASAAGVQANTTPIIIYMEGFIAP
jgi:hypothetical protein